MWKRWVAAQQETIFRNLPEITEEKFKELETR